MTPLAEKIKAYAISMYDEGFDEIVECGDAEFYEQFESLEIFIKATWRETEIRREKAANRRIMAQMNA